MQYFKRYNRDIYKYLCSNIYFNTT